MRIFGRALDRRLLLVPALVGLVGLLSWPALAAGSGTRTGTTLTVVGYGLVNLPTANPDGGTYQLQLNYQVSGKTAAAALNAYNNDVAAAEARLKTQGVPASDMTVQGPPNINFQNQQELQQCQKNYKFKGITGTCPNPGFQVSSTLQVTLPSLSAMVKVMTAVNVSSLPGVNNFWENQNSSYQPTPSAAAELAGYAQAFASAKHMASTMAKADHMLLGPQEAVSEGAMAASSCSAMGGCGSQPIPGINPPPTGPNQSLVAVTVTYALMP